MSKTKKRAIAIVLAAVLLIGAVVGGTIAWLFDTSDTVTNTFTVGDINITLTETEGTKVGDSETNRDFAFLPGDTLAKDPKITVAANSEACYVYVKIEKENNQIGKINDIFDLQVASGWTQVTGKTNFWYKEVAATGSNPTEIYVLKGGDSTNNNGQVRISDKLTKEDVITINTADTKPAIKITAAAIQKSNLNSADNAFKKLPQEFTGEEPA